ncbi:MAG: ArsR family transcriptional regulator [Bacteroidota bacterium]
MKFFLNPGMSAHLRGLQEEFDESSNGIRVELNRLEEAGMLVSAMEGQKKIFRVATEHPLYADINSIVRKYLGLDKLVEQVVQGLGGLEKVYLTGEMAEGKFSNEVKLVFLGKLNAEYLLKVVSKTEELINKQVAYVIFEEKEPMEQHLSVQKNVLLWQK